MAGVDLVLDGAVITAGATLVTVMDMDGAMDGVTQVTDGVTQVMDGVTQAMDGDTTQVITHLIILDIMKELHTENVMPIIQEGSIQKGLIDRIHSIQDPADQEEM